MKKETGDLVRIGKNDYALGDKIGGGSEGSVFDFDKNSKFYDKQVIKLLDSSNKNKNSINSTYEHLKWLKNKNVKDNLLTGYVILPNTLIESDLGYVMRKTKGYSPLKKYLYPEEDFNEWYKNKYTLKKRYEVICSMFKALYTIHHEGLIFTDLSPNNIMVNDVKNNIVFIDSDNMRRRSDCFNGVLGTPGYMAPELYKNNIEDAKKIDSKLDPKLLSDCGRITADSDIFSAAIIAFQLLVLQHPYIGDIVEDAPPEEEERANRCETDFIFKDGTDNTSSSILCLFYDKVTTPEIRELFYKTFVLGKDRPSQRPTDEEFYEAFCNGKDSIVTCPHCGFQQIYNEKNTICADDECNRKIENKVVLEIYARYKNLSRQQIVNLFGDENIEVGKGIDFDFDGISKKDSFLISKLILDSNEEKYIYLRHFESTLNRNSEKCIAIQLSPDRDNYVYITVNNRLVNNDDYAPYISNMQFIDGHSRTEFVDPNFSGSQHFVYENKFLLFGQKKIGNVIKQVYGKFVRY